MGQHQAVEYSIWWCIIFCVKIIRSSRWCVSVCVSVCLAATLTLDLSLTVRMCCLPQESSALSLSVRNSVSMKSSLKMEAHNTINQHPFTEKGTHNSVNWHQPSLITAAESNIETSTPHLDLSLRVQMRWHYIRLQLRIHAPKHTRRNSGHFFFKVSSAFISSKCLFNAQMEEYNKSHITNPFVPRLSNRRQILDFMLSNKTGSKHTVCRETWLTGEWSPMWHAIVKWAHVLWFNKTRLTFYYMDTLEEEGCWGTNNQMFGVLNFYGLVLYLVIC